MRRRVIALLALLTLAAAPALGAQTPPAVHVLATGGTIASTRGADQLTGADLVDAVPGLDTLARVTVEQFSNIGSSRMTPGHWTRLAERIDELFRTRDGLAGVVVTHGTDTMEETAYFLHLTVPGPKPVVLTGAMRTAGAVGADGPANLYNAVRLAASDAARGRGTLVLLNDEIHSARAATKTNTSRPDAFASPRVGVLGVTDADAIVFRRESAPAPAHAAAPPFRVEPESGLPRVDVVYSYAGADGAAVRAAAGAGARGIVVATVGRGNVPPDQWDALRAAAEQGVAVVLSSRTGSGRVPVGRRDIRAFAPGAILGAGDLNPQKARVLLMLALTETTDAAGLAELLRTY